MCINKFYKILVAIISIMSVSVFIYFLLAPNLQNIIQLSVKFNSFLFDLILVLKMFSFLCSKYCLGYAKKA
jgi:hypothetical protein